ncbi:DUF3618 domain-containing protein [Asanoa sp. NPDC049573]|uniref:DUF3618 domain-containing protein n=1 Tax=Asanoa sp. NPDC049573 TaxID=3155396 RepID=UPI00343EFF71
MTASGNGHKSNGNPPSDPAVLRAEIRRTRAELGETVQLLAAKADVKARMKSSASQARDRFRAKASTTAARMRDSNHNGGRSGGQATLRADPVPVATLIGVAASAVAVILLVMRRRRR